MAIRRRTARRVRVAAVIAGFLASGTMMYGASYSAFTSTTSNPNDQWAAGTVVITDDDLTTKAMFTTGGLGVGQISGANMKPGAAVVNCIAVSYTGSLASSVKIYATSVSGVNGVSTGILNQLHIKIEEGTGGGFGSCGGFGSPTTIWDTSTHPSASSDLLTDFPTAYGASAVASATASWATSTTKTYRFTITLDSGVADTAQGATAQATFVWEARNT